MERLTKNIGGVICYVGEHKQNDEDIPAEMNASAVRDVLTSLFAYEEAEEQGRMVVFPCEIGTPCFRIYGCRCGEKYRENHCKVKGKAKLTDVIGSEYKTYYCKKIGVSTFALKDIANIGKTVFLTREAAEEALKKSLDTSRRI